NPSAIVRSGVVCPLQFLHLSHLKFHARRPAEDGNRNLEPRAPVIHLFHHAVEGSEWSFGHPHLLAHLEGDRRFRPFYALLPLVLIPSSFDFPHRLFLFFTPHSS